MMAALQNSMSLLTRKGTRVNLCDRFFGFGPIAGGAGS
jgi:hypothetical protein